MWETTWRQTHNEARKHRADYFKPFWKTKKGHWKLIYPDVYTMKCPKCGLVFNQWGTDLGRWIKKGAKCRACKGGSKLPSDAVRIRKACIESKMTYLDLGVKANYSESRVRNVANGFEYNEEVAKYIADVAEEMAKEKEHGNSRFGYQHH